MGCGAAFGLSHNFMQVLPAPAQPAPVHKNLYFVGASTHPGTGLPIVLLSARLVVERILKEQVAITNRTIATPAAERVGRRTQGGTAS
jgi:phytoene desaturase